MKVFTQDIWELYDSGMDLVVTTNKANKVVQVRSAAPSCVSVIDVDVRS